jgi:DNA-binding LacI/PurR family transcriptional regulator
VVQHSASIEDVARLAGVSIATVSRSLRGLPEVAPSTRARVLAAAAELDYVASPFAARLASGRTSTVGIIVPWLSRWFFAEVLGAVEAELRRASCDLLIFTVGNAEQRDAFFATLPVRKRVDSVIVVSLVLTEAERDALASLRLPIGLVGSSEPGWASVGIDDVAAAELAVNHLIALGHRRIALIGGDTDDPMRFTPPMYRRNGYLNALARAGLAADPDLEVLGYFTTAGGEAAMRTLLAQPDRPTAVFAESDEMAYGALRAARRAGLRVPEDLAIIGFDDHASAELLDLSTIRQPVVELGRRIAAAMLAAVACRDAATHAVTLPTELIVRGSTDRARSTY